MLLTLPRGLVLVLDATVVFFVLVLKIPPPSVHIFEDSNVVL